MIDFNGIDLVVQHRIEDDRIRRALAAALSVPEQRVAVIDDLATYPDVDSADVVCVAMPLEGEFACQFSVQAELALPYATREQLMQHICELLGTRCFIPDEDTDPYVMWLLSPGMAPGKIELDPAALDEGRYLVVRR